MVTFRSVLDGTPLYGKLAIIIDDAQNSWLRDLGKNDFIHSKNVEALLDRMVPDNLKTNEKVFDHGEIFLLITAVYLHDIGRKSPEGHHELKSYEEIKDNPERYHLQNKHIAKAVAQLCAAHAPEFIWPIENCDKDYGIFELTSSGRTFNLQRLGALLRITDELDHSYGRVRGISGQEESARHLIRDVNPVPQRLVIEIQADPQSWEEWYELVKIRDRSQSRLREVTKYLEDAGLGYYQIRLRPEGFYVPLSSPIGASYYHDMVNRVAILAGRHYTYVESHAKIENSEISVLCVDRRLGTLSKTAIIVRDQITPSAAYEIRGVLSHLAGC